MSATKPLNRFQVALAKTYAAGDYAWITHSRNWKNSLHDIGDTLFQFLMIELSDAEECTNQDTALRRLGTAERDLQDVVAAIENLSPAEPPATNAEHNGKRIVATFVAQVWINDLACEDATLQPATFDVTDTILAMGRERALQLRDDQYETDQLRASPHAPAWVGDWPGPFAIEVEQSIADYFADSTAPATPQRYPP